MAKAATVRAEIAGLRPLFAKLERFRQGVRNRVLRPAVNAGTVPVLKAAKAKCPVEEGWLRRSLGRVVKVYRQSGVVVGVIGPRTGFRKTREGKRVLTAYGKRLYAETDQRPTQYAHLVEYGHGGRHPAAAKAFLQPAWDTTRAQAEQALRQKLTEGIEREAAKA